MLPTSPVELVVEGKPRPVGSITVARVLPTLQRRTVGPFVFLDHMGPETIPPGQGFDVAPHPHIGLSTVTYLLEGEVMHRDSVGSLQAVRPGEINLMTAGRGIVHSERADVAWRAAGGVLHGVQMWLGLPTADEEGEPSFEHHPQDVFPQVSSDGVVARTLLGEGSPVVHASRPLLVDVALDAGAHFDVAPSAEPRALFVLAGAIGIDGDPHRRDRLLVLVPGAPCRVQAVEPARLLLLGGPPLDGPRYMDWNFVSSSRERLERAKADWRARRFPVIVGDHTELIPYPGEPRHP